MNAQKTENFDHDTDVDLTHEINTMELDNWINHLKYINKELVNLTGIYSKKLSAKLEDHNVLNRLLKKQAENETLLNALNKYVIVRSNLRECDDIQCDMVYITEHESYRRSYLYHLDKYRRLKEEFFKKVRGKFTLLSID
tara:strand:- start:7709 stop:8128 length:420 start_codon:yes stop_codon:yes gene_type:complete